MNTFGSALIWGAIQATAFALLGTLLYGLSRRRGPEAASLVALSVLLLAACITMLAFCPWPEGWNLSTTLVQSSITSNNLPVPLSEGSDSAETATRASSVPATKSVPALAPSDRDRDRQKILQAAWSGFIEGLRSETSSPGTTAWRWPAVIAVILLVGMLIGLLRLGFGLVSVAHYRRSSRAIRDIELNELLACICSELGCVRFVELRESSLLDSPATVGWRRALLLLPLDWASWSQAECRAVLAHEVAHIQRSDYLAWLLAQLCLVLHFYNPVVHWLVNRLRIEQELAADSSGAIAVGGRERYLTALAQMAIRLDNRSATWAARPFLPNPGTVIRRIEMLRDAKSLQQAPLRRSGRALLFGTLVVLGIGIAGLRTPFASETSPERVLAIGEQAKESMSLTFVPPDAAFVLSLRPAAIAQQEGMADLLTALGGATDLEKKLGIALSDIEEVTLVVSTFPPPNGRVPFELIAARTKQAGLWKALVEKIKPQVEEEKLGGRIYFKPKDEPAGQPASAITLLDEKTLLFANEDRVREILEAGGQPWPRKSWAGSWEQVATGQAAAMFNVQKIRKHLKAAIQHGPDAALLVTLAPLWEQSERVLVGVQLNRDVAIQALALCPSNEAAKQVQQTAQALATFAANGLGELQKNSEVQVNENVRVLLGVALSTSKQIRFEQSGTTVTSRTDLKFEAGQTLARTLIPAVRQARVSAERMRSVNNLKQIALAMHNYMSVYDHFPAAAVLGPDGKTVHSWRVALLPFLEQDHLYKQYKLNEPWDSENNRKVLAQMPAVYRALDDDKSTNASYFVFTGPEAIFSGKAGTKVAEITDGLSNTILAVESKQDIPWTKPEDLPYDAKRPLPKLGGFFEKGYNAALADGSVRFLQEAIKEPILRALITKAGGEVISEF